MRRWLAVDGAEHLVDNEEWMRRVVVVGGPPAARRVARNDLVDLVKVESSRSLAGSGSREPVLVSESSPPPREVDGVVINRSDCAGAAVFAFCILWVRTHGTDFHRPLSAYLNELSALRLRSRGARRAALAPDAPRDGAADAGAEDW
jgi:hypothetical protein